MWRDYVHETLRGYQPPVPPPPIVPRHLPPRYPVPRWVPPQSFPYYPQETNQYNLTARPNNPPFLPSTHHSEGQYQGPPSRREASIVGCDSSQNSVESQVVTSLPGSVTQTSYEIQNRERIAREEESSHKNQQLVVGDCLLDREQTERGEPRMLSRKSPESVISDLLQKQVNAAYDALFALARPAKENKSKVAISGDRSTGYQNDSKVPPVQHGVQQKQNPDKIYEAAKLAPWTKRRRLEIVSTSEELRGKVSVTNSRNDCKKEPENVINLCDDEELETHTIKRAKSVTRICQQDTAIHVCCTETCETIEEIGTQPCQDDMPNRWQGMDDQMSIGDVEENTEGRTMWRNTFQEIIPYDSVMSQCRRSHLPAPVHLGFWDRWRPESCGRTYVQRFASGGMRSPFTSKQKCRYEREQRRKRCGRMFSKCNKDTTARGRCRYKTYENFSREPDPAVTGPVKEADAAVQRSENKIKKNTQKIIIELASDDRRKISLEKGKSGEIQVFAVDDDGGEILEKEKAEEMQIIAVDDDGGEILEKEKAGEMQVIAVDDGGGEILEKEKAEEMQVIAVDDDGGEILEKGKEEQIQIFAVDDDGGEL